MVGGISFLATITTTYFSLGLWNYPSSKISMLEGLL
jgi:hypothetical protein